MLFIALAAWVTNSCSYPNSYAACCPIPVPLAKSCCGVHKSSMMWGALCHLDLHSKLLKVLCSSSRQAYFNWNQLDFSYYVSNPRVSAVHTFDMGGWGVHTNYFWNVCDSSPNSLGFQISVSQKYIVGSPSKRQLMTSRNTAQATLCSWPKMYFMPKTTTS